MKKIIIGIITLSILLSTVACTKNNSAEQESEIATDQDVTYPTRKFVEGSIQIETTSYASRDGWTSEQETTDIKEIANTHNLEFSRESGTTINVTESVYSGDSNLSKYDIKCTIADGTELNISFEGPSGLHGHGTFSFESDYFFTITSESKDKKIQIGVLNFCTTFGFADDEYAALSQAMPTMKDELTDKEFLDMFMIKEATYITKTDEYMEFLYENGDYSNIGYSYLKWIYTNPSYIIVDYFENKDSYNDDNVILIYDSLKWE